MWHGRAKLGIDNGPDNRRHDRRLHPAAVLRIVRQCAGSVLFTVLACVREGCRNVVFFRDASLYSWFASREHRASSADGGAMSIEDHRQAIDLRTPDR